MDTAEAPQQAQTAMKAALRYLLPLEDTTQQRKEALEARVQTLLHRPFRLFQGRAEAQETAEAAPEALAAHTAHPLETPVEQRCSQLHRQRKAARGLTAAQALPACC